MGINSTANWRIRAGGSDANGGGYDSTITATQSTTTTGVTSGATTMTVASATNWPTSGNYYARIGNVGAETFSSGGTGSSEIVQVTAGQGTTTWTITRAQLGTTAQAFASGTVVDNELSRCDTAVALGTHGTSTASTTFIDATFGAFNKTHIGNALHIASGTGASVGFYIIQSVTNATTVVLDRTSGTYTVGVWKIGGAWSTANVNVAGNVRISAGNIVYYRSTSNAGTVASPDYTISGGSGYVDFSTGPSGTSTGMIRFIGENGRPVIKSSSSSAAVFYTAGNSNFYFENLYCVAAGATNPTFGIIGNNNTNTGSVVIYNVILDQNGFDIHGVSQSPTFIANSEIFSSTANSGAAGSNFGLELSNAPNTVSSYVINCNIHDCWGTGISLAMSSVCNSIISKNRGSGINVDSGTSSFSQIVGNTIDSNNGNGILVANSTAFSLLAVMGNIISNHTTASTYGISITGATLSQNDQGRAFVNFNSYFGNNSDTHSLLTVGTGTQLSGSILHDNIGVDPGFVSVANENYAIGTALKALGFPQSAYLNSLAGKAPPTSYVDAGGVQRQEPAAGGGATIGFLA